MNHTTQKLELLPLVPLLREVIGVADACGVMAGLPGLTHGERKVWQTCGEEITAAVGRVVPDWDGVLKAAYEAEKKRVAGQG